MTTTYLSTIVYVRVGKENSPTVRRVIAEAEARGEHVTVCPCHIFNPPRTP